MVTGVTSRTRQRGGLEREIRRAARRILNADGRDAVGLRAIARELGVTAPALYRYFDSKDALLAAVYDDVDAEVAAALTAAEEQAPRLGEKPVAAAWAFRRWAIEYPREFEMMFSFRNAEFRLPLDSPILDRLRQDKTVQVFFRGVVAALAAGEYTAPGEDAVPEIVRESVRASHQEFVDALAVLGMADAERFYTVGAEFVLTTAWIKVFGHVALEVHGPDCFGHVDPARLFAHLLWESLQQFSYSWTPEVPD